MGDATTDFKFAYENWFSSASSWGKGPYLKGQNGAGHIWGAGPAYCTDAIRLASNYQIKPTLANNNFHWVTNYWDSLNGTFTGKTNNCQGNFNNATGLLGVRFHTGACQGSNFNYGWIRYRGDTISSGTIIDWAYEDQCNIAIASGAAGPGFEDAPLGYWAYRFIMALYAAGITGGCSVNPPLFCPENIITRGQMAVFMEASLGVTPAPPCTGTVFNDVNATTVGSAFCGYIEDFASRGITAGCGGGNYCPFNPVTRQQMAVFIEAALGGFPVNCPLRVRGR